MPQFSFLRPRRPVGVRLSALRGDGLVLVPASGTGWSDEQAALDVLVTNVAVNDAELLPDGLFAALPGRRGHGADFAAAAALAGAVAVLTDDAGVERASAAGLPSLVVADPRRHLGRLSARVSGTESRRPRLLGVTGTNGKTTTVHVLHAVLRQLGVPAGLSSTAERRSLDAAVASRLTSPEATELHALLARMAEDGVHTAALEVSAQALSRHRVDGLRFDVVGFTNLSHDHRDDYPTSASYLEAKLALFDQHRAERGVVLLDSPAGREIAARSGVPVTTVATGDGVDQGEGAGEAPADWRLQVTASSATSTSFRLERRDGRVLRSSVPLIGRHMAADAALALVMLVEAGHAVDELQEAVERGIEVTVPGRTLDLSGVDGPRVYTDFSHTPDSVAKTLEALRTVTDGRLVVVIGADGDRDPSKREPMGRAAADAADLVVVTDHHPRTEDPASIRHALVAGARTAADERRRCRQRVAAVVELADPADAIRHAVSGMGPGDTVLWVGPGDTDYRVVGTEDVPYSPRQDARAALREAGWRA
ncbi:UDP-N-acetylmuramoylalanyl-D-glutamate--2,6-diaminopimelate ligase [Frigoribacterium sp. PhB107]|uniref:Mur ligase family protein n=1 Tax=Frigoribacterium sp. PhB107 TaxID=2485172 RepID=UPI000FA5A0A7|nr:UDP-N-acetylmuramoyl-L-alanyl-D-glutamate--2,6-diaminopimelate ligase [Frigoribacterium sp. PhB107]ROP78704.1 UDP-N-acetylmuramoylalanyl-D-glutamate--2,6-diaminopimelate ligase [Frigoribacterium sp. PhB107]